MRAFMDKDFLLDTDTARSLYHEAAAVEPIVDFHNHLNPQEIYEDRRFDNMTEVWLGGDHYKWRAMRANGIPERLITGDGADYDKFLAWAGTVQNLIGNPLYHWTHLELQRYFGVEEPFGPASAGRIWERCNEKLRSQDGSVRSLLRQQNVRVLCTTDDPADDLIWHRRIREDGFEIQVLPSFRPEKALGIDKEGFAEYMGRLSEASGVEVKDVETLLAALKKRLGFFLENGCRVSDHSLESTFYVPAKAEEADAIFQKRMRGEVPPEEDCGRFRGWLLTELGREYARKGIVMQLHIGAIRNNSARFFRILGADAGFDSISDFTYAAQLAALLSAMDETGELPRTILYCLNPRDLEMLAAMAGNFQSNEEGIRGKVQLGAAWWFCDHKNGMEHQMDALSDVGMLSTFVGMLTDSRSFLSFPRHEYFRRILCGKVGRMVENGEYPADMDYLRGMIRDICGRNAEAYFRFG